MADILSRLTDVKALEKLYNASQANKGTILSDEDIARIIEELQSEVIGQDKAMADLVEQYSIRLAMEYSDKPRAVVLEVGPPGVGKTHASKRFAKKIGKKCFVIDMTQFKEAHTVSQLFGSPKGYAGSDKYGLLTATLRDYPDAVIVLDEVEKADRSVLLRLLTAWNDGWLTEVSDGKKISTVKATFICTSNVAYEQIQEATKQLGDNYVELRKVCTNILRECGFAPELLSRIDFVSVFYPLVGMDIARIAALELVELVNKFGLTIADGGVDPQILFDAMAQQEATGAEGARQLVQAIEGSCSKGIIKAKQQSARSVRFAKDDEGNIVVQPVFD